MQREKNNIVSVAVHLLLLELKFPTYNKQIDKCRADKKQDR